MKMKQSHMIEAGIALAVVMAGAGFFGGIKYQQSKGISAFRGTLGGANNQMGRTSAQGQAGRGGQMMGGRQVIGDIIAVDEKTMTVKMPDGSSRIVVVSETTSINKASVGTKTDLKVGEKVAVFGSDNTDKSVTATNIQLNPIQRVGSDSATPRK